MAYTLMNTIFPKKNLESSAKANNYGFTLIEILIALAISSIGLGAIYFYFEKQQQTYVTQERVSDMQQNIRAAMLAITQDLRMAGYDPDNTASAGFTATTNSTKITFTYLADSDGTDNDGDVAVDEANELETLIYDLYDAYADGDQDIGRQTSGGARQAIAENIETIEFYYTLDDGDGTTTLTLDPAGLNRLDDIRSVQVSLVATASAGELDYTNTSTYTLGSGAVWNPVDDTLRRRIKTFTVNCRNMGLE